MHGARHALSLVALLAGGCAEDRILDPEAVCGDGVWGRSEQCDVPSDGCVSCKVMPGWQCTAESCTTTCGDGIVAGAEECDPPGESACNGACWSSFKSESCDMTGYWVAREMSFSIDDVISQVQTTSVWHFFRIVQTGDAFEVAQALMCSTETTGSAHVVLTAGGDRGMIYRNAEDGSGTLRQPARRGTFSVDGENCSFSFERFYHVRGAEDRFLPDDPRALPDLASLPALPYDDNPAQDPTLPTSQNLDGATDDDGDGFPGLAFQISGNLTGRRNTAQRDYSEYFPHPDFVIRQHTAEFAARGSFNNQENILHVSDCPQIGCGILLAGSVPSQNLAHRIVFRYLGKNPTDPHVAAVLAGEPHANIDDDLVTCARVREELPHDPAKE